MREVQTEEFVAGVQYGHKYGHVGLGSRVGLYVGPFGIENLFQPVDGKLFRLVYHLATAIVAFAGIAFGIFVGQTGTHGFHNLVTDKIFRGDKFDAFHLTLTFAGDDVENGVVSLHCF